MAEFCGISEHPINYLNPTYKTVIKAYSLIMTENNSTLNEKLLEMEFLRDPFWDPCSSYYISTTYQSNIWIIWPVLYADDTSLMITNCDSQMFEGDLNATILKLNKFFNSNLLLFNLEESYFLNSWTKLEFNRHTQTAWNRQISDIGSIKFLGIVIDSYLSWHSHIDQLIPKLNKASYVIRALKSFLPFTTHDGVLFNGPFTHIIRYNILGLNKLQ